LLVEFGSQEGGKIMTKRGNPCFCNGGFASLPVMLAAIPSCAIFRRRKGIQCQALSDVGMCIRYRSICLLF
jgi:hypothetical protein